MKAIVTGILFALPPIVAGCGGQGSSASGPDPAQLARTPLGRGALERTCDSVVFAGSGIPNWRARSAHRGPLGMSGEGGPGFEGPSFARGVFEDGLLNVKVPMLVEGHRRVALSISGADRHRAAFIVDLDGRRYARFVFIPCEDRKRTIWPSGLVLRDREPVTVLVRAGDGPARPLRIGGPA